MGATRRAAPKHCQWLYTVVFSDTSPVIASNLAVSFSTTVTRNDMPRTYIKGKDFVCVSIFECIADFLDDLGSMSFPMIFRYFV